MRGKANFRSRGNAANIGKWRAEETMMQGQVNVNVNDRLKKEGADQMPLTQMSCPSRLPLRSARGLAEPDHLATVVIL